MAEASPAQTAKAALRRLALQRLEPTPDQYARAWVDEGGAPVAWVPERVRPLLERLLQRPIDDATLRGELLACLSQGRWDDLPRLLERSADAAAAQSEAWASLVERVARGVERGGRQWTAARRKDSLQRVVDGSRHDAVRLQQRLQQLLASWEQDAPAAFVESVQDEALATGNDASVSADAATRSGATPVAATERRDVVHAPSPAPSPPPAAERPAAAPPLAWVPIAQDLQRTVDAALRREEPRAVALADELARLAARIPHEGATPALAAELGVVCERARRWLGHHHHLVDSLAALCRELVAGLGELAEDASWAQGQMHALGARLDAGLSARGVKAAGELLARTRAHQHRLRAERDQARNALRELVATLLAQLGELDDATGRYGERLGRYEAAIAQAPSVDALASVVQQMLDDNRAVRADVQHTRQRLADEHARAAELESRVRALEDELRRLSDEVSTDTLTEVANRRGLLQAFEVERSRAERAPQPAALAVGLLDIDNFKRLNDTLGHAAGDQALKSLASRVRDLLRPGDTIGRWGGEEFVVLLPGTDAAEAQQVLTRLQRALSAGLFLHEGREVFVTFSAGVTAWRAGEAIDAALERADEALYEAKRTGKNRTCAA